MKNETNMQEKEDQNDIDEMRKRSASIFFNAKTHIKGEMYLNLISNFFEYEDKIIDPDLKLLSFSWL